MYTLKIILIEIYISSIKSVVKHIRVKLSLSRVGNLNQKNYKSSGSENTGYSVNISVNILHRHGCHFETDKDKWIMFSPKCFFNNTVQFMYNFRYVYMRKL